MPRPESPEGKWVTVPVRVRESLLARIDAARGEVNRSEWFRGAAEAAVNDSVPALLSRGGPIVSREQAEALGLTVEAKRLPPSARKPRKAAPETVTPAAEGVPAAAFREPAPVPAKRPSCPHPGTRVIGGFCKQCDALAGPGGELPADWVKPAGWKR